MLFGIADEPPAAAAWAPKEEILGDGLSASGCQPEVQTMLLWGLEFIYTFNILGFDRTVLEDVMITLDGNP